MLLGTDNLVGLTGEPDMPEITTKSSATSDQQGVQPRIVMAIANALPDNLDELSLPQDFCGGKTKEIPTTHEIRKPKKQEWIQVSGVWQKQNVPVMTTVEDFGKIYVVSPKLITGGDLEPGEYYVANIVAVVTTGHNVFFWPVAVSNDSSDSQWVRSANIAAAHAVGSWVRVLADQTAGKYRVRSPECELPAPAWPETSLEDLYRIALRDRYIGTREHAVIANLRGSF